MEEEEARSPRSTESQRESSSRSWVLFASGLLIAFLLGLLPMWWSKSGVAYDLDQTKRELRRSQLQNALSAASLYARRGEYETGRQNASTFFTELQAEMDKADSDVFTAQERTQIPGLLAGRDDAITLLSRSDPASGDKLSDMYVAYRSITGAKPPQ